MFQFAPLLSSCTPPTRHEQTPPCRGGPEAFAGHRVEFSEWTPEGHVRHASFEGLRADKPCLRHAVEVRHNSFCTSEFPALLREHRVALVASHAMADWPYAEDVTSDFVYMRLRGTDALYSGAYPDASLDRWAARIYAWAHGKEPSDATRIAPQLARTVARRDVYCYFDNDKKVNAPFDAQRLRERVIP